LHPTAKLHEAGAFLLPSIHLVHAWAAKKTKHKKLLKAYGKCSKEALQ